MKFEEEYYNVRTQNYDMYCYQGESWSHTITIQESNGQLKDLTGYEAYMQIKSNESGGLRINVNCYIIPQAGIIELSMSPGETSKMNFSNAYYDLMIKNNTGQVIYLIKGRFIVIPRITRLEL